MKLKFGTGGLRAKMIPGPEGFNMETIREATLGVAAYAKTLNESPKLAISYDSRINSEAFARETARVLAIEGCQVFLYPKLMPTPALSFAIRYLDCDLGISITASHNPKEYNGYKVYGSDGCQITGTVAQVIQKNIEKGDGCEIAPGRDFDEILKTGVISYIEPCVENAYLEEMLKLRTTNKRLKYLKVVYTPLNGAGRDCMVKMLTAIGVEQLHLVKEQLSPDGNFPTCPYPNPEEDAALELGILACQTYDADILLATDPDSDRVGVAAKCGDTYQRLTGNQIGVLMLDYLLKIRTEKEDLLEKPLVIKTIVTTFMIEEIAKQYGAEIINTLTGFKYIGEQICRLEAAGQLERFVFGVEESCGYLIGPYVRDKDAVGAAMIICEMAEYYKMQGKTLWSRLEELYVFYGYHETELKTYHFEENEAQEYMRGLRSDLKSGKSVAFEGGRVENYLDYLDGVGDLPRADVLKLWMEDGAEMIVRPSGTEPKIKVYKESVKQTA